MKKNISISIALFLLILSSFSYAQTTLVAIGKANNCNLSKLSLIWLKFPASSTKCCETPKSCVTNLLGTSYQWAGGSVWDPVFEGAWVSDGNILEFYKLKSCSNPCQCNCPVPCSKPFYWYFQYRSYITGIAINPYKRLLYISDYKTYRKESYIYTFQITGKCGIKEVAKVKWPNLNNDILTGLTFSCVPKGPLTNGILFVARKYARTSGTAVYETEVDSRGYPTLRVLCNNVVNLYVTGLALDPCKSVLYLSSWYYRYNTYKIWAYAWDQMLCKYKPLCSCDLGKNYSLYGLGIRYSGSTSYPALYGTQSYCLGSSSCHRCAATPATSGRPSIGNTNFSINFKNGPSPKGFLNFAWLALNSGGPCRKTPLSFFLCNKACTNMSWYTGLSPFPTLMSGTVYPGTSSCGLSGTVKLPIPCDTVFCSASLCTQWIILNISPSANKCCVTFSKGLFIHIGCP